MTTPSSRWPGCFQLSLEQRRQALIERCGLDAGARDVMDRCAALPLTVADHMVENCIGTFDLPIGLGVNLKVDGVDRLVPMAVEEPSVIAGVSNAARLLREGRGIVTEVGPAIMIGQIQVLDVLDPEAAEARVRAAEAEILALANDHDPLLVRVGGGARGLETRVLLPESPYDPVGPMFVVHLLVDVRDAMGANAVNTMAERIAPRIEALTGGRARLRILSNLADRRLVKVRAEAPVACLDRDRDPARGLAVARGIEEASVFAERDPYRATTHNKGIMNGIDAVLVAAGQDWRAVEAGAHAFAARTGRYRALSSWRVRGDRLHGELELPLAVGTVGGAVRVHPMVQLALEIMGIRSAADLAAITGAVGLAQNLGALAALATVGIQHGHMRLHARKLAADAGATDAELAALCEALLREGRFDPETAARLLGELRERTP
jgi:hydroxymethylglutaryl-CoA reductase